MFSTVSALFYICFALIWKQDDWPNAALRFALIIMAIWAVITAAVDWGFLIQMEAR